MGGCKCSYRNCTVKSDGKTHMFHFPVFDKLRCHQWLTNACKLEFLNLKVSQLKNRVVCQHHFQPHNFMNYKMDKLKFDAVPTENGPYCNSDEEVPDLKIALDPEEIDIEPLTSKDKVASMKVKFAEFLRNSEADPTEPIKITDSFTIKDGSEPTDSLKIPYRVLNKPPIEFKFQQNQPVPPFSQSTYQIFTTKNENILNVEFEKNSQAVPAPEPRIKIISEKKIVAPITMPGRLQTVSPSVVLKPKEIQNESLPITSSILDKENNQYSVDLMFYNSQDLAQNVITDQMAIQPQLIDIQSNRCAFVVSPMDKNFEIQLSQPFQLVDGSQPLIMPDTNQENSNKNDVNQFLLGAKNNISQNRKPNTPTSTGTSPGKSKVPPERLAAIEEKRKFNKRLKDMIEFCLDEVDTPEKLNKQQTRVLSRRSSTREVKAEDTNQEEPVKPVNVNDGLIQKKESLLKSKNPKIAKNTQKVVSHLAEETSLPSAVEYTLGALEQRLQKMEETLLNKISQNTRTILELKNTITSTTNPAAKTVVCQTKEDEGSYKKQLFNEISQFLRPQTKSLIYEEMFLNKFSKNSTTVHNSNDQNDEYVEVEVDLEHPKRRRRRR